MININYIINSIDEILAEDHKYLSQILQDPYDQLALEYIKFKKDTEHGTKNISYYEQAQSP